MPAQHRSPPGRPRNRRTLAACAILYSGGSAATIWNHDTPASPRAAAQRAIYRTVQEALTNIRKHAPGATATIRMRYDDATIEVIITNTPATRPTLPLPGARHGLIGLRERTELFGGAVTAGPTAENGYQIQLRLPTTTQ
jgi:signal transduction histidine kinase